MAIPTLQLAGMDEQSRHFLEQMNALEVPPLETLPVSEVRPLIESFNVPSMIELADISTIKIPGPQGEIPLRIYTPKGQGPFPVFIMLHGGGWIFGSLETHDRLCRSLAQQATILVVSVDYRLAPEHKYPAGLKDCYTAADWVAKHIQAWNGDSKRLAIGGDSAGGNLAAAVTLLAKKNKFPLFKTQVLIYPVLHHCFDTPSYQKYEEGCFLTKKQMQWFWNLYLSKSEEGSEPYASPLLAKDLSDLPSALFVLAAFDPLYSEGLAYSKRLQAAHVSARIHTYPTIHVFITKDHELEIAKKAIADIAQFLKEQLYAN